MTNYKFGPNWSNPDVGTSDGTDSYIVYDDGFGNKTIIKNR